MKQTMEEAAKEARMVKKVSVKKPLLKKKKAALIKGINRESFYTCGFLSQKGMNATHLDSSGCQEVCECQTS